MPVFPDPQSEMNNKISVIVRRGKYFDFICVACPHVDEKSTEFTVWTNRTPTVELIPEPWFLLYQTRGKREKLFCVVSASLSLPR